MAKRELIYTLAFDGRAGDDRDLACRDIIDRHGGRVTASGTFLMSDPPVRDLDFVVDANKAPDLVATLRDAGFTVEQRLD